MNSFGKKISKFCYVFDPKNRNPLLNLANNDSASITGKGNVSMTVTNKTEDRKIMLEDTLFAPDVRMNLMSVSKITDRDHEVIFRKDKDIIQDCQRKN